MELFNRQNVCLKKKPFKKFAKPMRRMDYVSIMDRMEESVLPFPFLSTYCTINQPIDMEKPS